jgi:hypothetical protein
MVSDLVARIRQWIKMPGVMETVRSAVRECVSEKLASNTGPWNLLERPSSELSLQEKCTLIAVHHDEVFPDAPVHPWHSLHRQLKLADEEMRNLGGRLHTETEAESAAAAEELDKAVAATRYATNEAKSAAAAAVKKLTGARAAKKNAKSAATKEKADEAVKVATKDKKKADRAAASAIEAKEEHEMAVSYHILQLELANPDEAQLIIVGEILDDVQHEMGFATETESQQIPAVADDILTADRMQAVRRLLSVYTNGVSDERIDGAARVLLDDELNTNEKLTEIDELMPIPPTATAEQLGRQLIGVTKQAVMKTAWWKKKRKGQKQTEIALRQSILRDKAKQHEPNQMNDEDQ